MVLQNRRATVLAGLLAIVTVVGCGNSTESGGNPPSPQPPSPPQDEAVLPEGHPPVGTVTPQGVIPAVPADFGVGATGLTWDVPAGWIEEAPSSSMRRAQFRVPGDAGDGECVVFYFGPGQGGDPMSNAVRWANQFVQPDGSPSAEALTTEQTRVSEIPVLLSEITGTYGGGMSMMGGPSQTLEDYMLLGAVAEGPDANWFFKFTGPRETVEANRTAFETMIQSLSAGGSG